MTRYTQLYQSIAELEANHKEPELINSICEFPFSQMYSGQAEILSKVQNGESFCLTSHTGFGKSPVFLSLTRNKSSIIIEPRKFLQAQIATYYNDFILYGRSGYPCHYAHSASSAPCLLKDDCSNTTYHRTCKNASGTCLNKPCTIFPVKDTFERFPCSDCEYLKATREAINVLHRNGTVICNFGNFWNLLKHADTVVIDEADLFFREISAPIPLRYSKPAKHETDSIKDLLKREVQGLQADSKDPDPKFRYKVSNALYNAQFLLANAELCFKYSRKDRIYVEIDPRNVNILSQKLFKDKRVIIVSATAGQFDLPSYSAEIHQRCKIYFAPVGNLTSRSLKANPYLMSGAAKAIEEISDYFEMVYDNEKVIIFCGNLGTHAASLHKILGDDTCTIHQSGQLAESVERFKQSEKRYFLVAGAEWGLDAQFVKLQFLLKHPFPNIDERTRTLMRVMGPEFNNYYENEARIRVTQTFGRNVRGANDFGITVCLDSKTHDDYVKNKDKYPSWLHSRIDTKVY